MMWSRKKNLRVVSAFVLTSFVGSLSAPAFAAGAAPAAPTASSMADTMTAVSSKALSDMWFVWGRHLQAFQGPKNALTPNYAAEFFRTQGANAAQVEVLVNNARSQGHLTAGLPSAASASSLLDKLKGLFKKTGTPGAAALEAEAAAASSKAAAAPASQTGLTAKVKSFFTRFKPSTSVASGAAAGSGSSPFPIPGGSSGSAASASAGGGAAVPLASGNADPGLLSSIVAKVKAGTAAAGNAVKGAADTVALGARRGAYAVGSTAKTGFLTAKYAIDPRPYFEIPIHGDTAIKVRGSHSSTVAFKEGKWTVQDFSYKSTWPTKGDLAVKVDGMAAQPQASGFFGQIISKFKGMVSNVQARMRGEAHITPETKAEIQRLELSNSMIDQARTLADAQRALKVRIDQLKHTSESLRRPLDVQKVEAMENQFRALEKTKQDLLKKSSGVMDSKASVVMKDAAKWALYSVGITASVNLIRQAFSGDGIDIGAAFSFMAQPSFWGGTAGGFLGSMLVSTLTAGLLPPGAGIFLRVLPGFLGAALGFEFGGSLFGGEMDLMGTLVTTLASAGGYSLAFTLLGGAAAPGIALIGAAIAAGSLAGFLLDKFRGGPESESYILPESPVAEGMGTASASVEPASEAAASMSPVAQVNLSTAQGQVDQAYNAYITYLKARKIPEATTAHKAYMDAVKALELAKSNASMGK